MNDVSWLLFITVALGAVFSLVTFGLVKSLHKTTQDKYHPLLACYAVLVGVGIFTNVYMSANALNMLAYVRLTLPYAILSFGFSVVIGFTVLDAANKKNLPIKLLSLGGLQASISGFAIFYFLTKAALTHPFELLLIPTALAMTLSFVVGVLSIITLFWLKTYDGIHPNKVKGFFALVISVGITATYIAFNSAIQVSDLAHVQTNLSGNLNTMLSAMVFIFLFLTAFIVIIFYDKLNQNTVKGLNFKSGDITKNLTAAFDPLTKLPNRDSLNQHLQLTAKRCERIGDSMALAYIDLDYFKPVNDNFGHHVGDLLLIEVAERFNSAIRNCDYIARTGGDEFVAILGEIDAHESIIAVVQRILDAVKEPFYIEGHFIEISCSVGVAIYPRDGNLEKLKVSADAAMYKAKESGRNQFRFYDAEIEQASDEMQKLRNELLCAMEQSEFMLYFQPKVDAKTQAPAGAEALLRWNHPKKGILTPIYFLEAAERFGLIEKINTWVIMQSCKTIFNARKHGINLNLSVNLSRQQFRNPQLVDYIKTIMAQYDIEPQNLIFEISETHAIHNQNQFKKLLSKFKLAKLKVSIDDFGLHPFSLTYLQNLEVSEVKLDKSFTAGVAKYRSSLAIVEAVVKLAHALNLSVVAEGVESEEQRKALAHIGCNQLQGYYFSKPIPELKLFDLFNRLNNGFNQTGQFAMSDYLGVSAQTERI